MMPTLEAVYDEALCQRDISSRFYRAVVIFDDIGYSCNCEGLIKKTNDVNGIDQERL